MKRALTILIILILYFSVPVSGADPGELLSHRMILHEGDILLSGGMRDVSTNWMRDEFWIYNGEWDELENLPSKIIDHSMVSTGDSVYIFGGTDSDGRTNNLWKYNDTWYEIETESSPPQRSSAVMVYDDLNNRLILFGGYAEVDDNKLDDTWEYDIQSNLWTKILTDTHPAKRYGPSMCVDTEFNIALLFGGNADGVRYSDLWLFNMTGDSWVEIESSTPSARYWHMAAYDSELHEMIVFGGKDYDDGTWKYDYPNNTWEELESKGPSARANGAMVFDGSNYVLYGGYAGEDFFDDLWILEDYVWVAQSSEEAPISFEFIIIGFVVLVYLQKSKRD